MWLHKIIKYNRSFCYRLSTQYPRIFRDEDYSNQLLERINYFINNKNEHLHILEIGGISRPLLKPSKDYNYLGLDIEYTEKCEELYDEFIIGSVEDPIEQKFDLIISKTLLEHVENNNKSYKQILKALNPEGETIHYFPSKNHPYSLLTRMVSHKWQRKLISLLRPQTVATTGYKTYYHLCSYAELHNYLHSLNFKKVEIKPFWGASDYFAFFFPFFILISIFNRICEKLNLVTFASGLIVYAKR